MLVFFLGILFLVFKNSNVLSLESNILEANLPLCQGNDHSIGHWRYNPNIQKSFHCCGWDNDDFLHNSSICGTFTSNRTLYHGSNDFLTRVGGNACICDNVDNTRDNTNKREQYEWIPTFCQLLPWDAVKFCNLLNGRRIVLIGDSTMSQSASTLMNMIFSNHGNCANQIYYQKSNFLLFTIKDDKKIEETLKDVNPDFCIINAGAHLQDLGDLNWILNYLQTDILLKFQKIKFIWRSNHPGHHNCHGTEIPSYFYDVNDSIDKYLWNYFPVYDTLVRNFSNYNDIVWLDMSPLYWRSDSHSSFIKRDCLHYCVPGPINLFSTLLLQKLYLNEI